jgi:hypothetical protein
MRVEKRRYRFLTLKGRTTMIDEKVARLRAHCNNISRYRRLLRTNLSDLERQFIERRLSEEEAAMEGLVSTRFPLILTSSNSMGEKPPSEQLFQ